MESSLKISSAFEVWQATCAWFSREMKGDFPANVQSHFFKKNTHLLTMQLHFNNQIQVRVFYNQMSWWVTCCRGGCDGKLVSAQTTEKLQSFAPSWKDVPRVSLCPLSLIRCVRISLSPVSFPAFTSFACFSLSTIVRQEVCHITCVLGFAGMCGGSSWWFSQDWGILKKLSRFKAKWYKWNKICVWRK